MSERLNDLHEEIADLKKKLSEAEKERDEWQKAAGKWSNEHAKLCVRLSEVEARIKGREHMIEIHKGVIEKQVKELRRIREAVEKRYNERKEQGIIDHQLEFVLAILKEADDSKKDGGS